MIYAVYGFVFGLLIPYISRRFAKFMPATMAYALVSLCKFSKKVTSEKWEKSLTYTKLRREFFYRSLLCGIVTAAVSYFAYAHFGSRGLWWQLYFIWSLLLLAEIDYRMFLLPDYFDGSAAYSRFCRILLGMGAYQRCRKRFRCGGRLFFAGFGQFVVCLEKQGCLRRRRHQAFGGTWCLAGF